jgi:hypothetical protein
MEWCKDNVDKLITADGLVTLRENGLQVIIEDYVMYLRKRVSSNSLTPILASLEIYFSMNDKVLNWKRVKKMIPEKVKKSGILIIRTRTSRNCCIVLYYLLISLTHGTIDPFTAAIIGAIVGGLVTFVPSYLIEYLKKQELRKNIKNLVKLELETIKKFLQGVVIGKGTARNGSIVFPQGNEARVEIREMMPDRYFKPVDYLSLQAETKSQVFSYNTLDLLTKTFRNIRDVYCYENEKLEFFFHKEKVDKAIQEIEKTINCM